MIRPISARSLVAMTVALGVLALGVATDVARAAFPGENGRIAYIKSDGATPAAYKIHAVNPDGSSPLQLSNGGTVSDFAPAYSPDGKTIAYMSITTGPATASIWLMNADGSGKHRLTSTAAPLEANPAFSADGKRVYFVRAVSTADLRLVSTRLDGSDEQTHLPGHSVARVVALPDGRLAWIGRTLAGCPTPDTSNPGCVLQVRVANPDGSSLHKLTEFALGAIPSEIDTTPDGKQLILTYGLTSPQYGASWGIASLNPDGPDNLSAAQVDARRLTSNPRTAFGAASPDGIRVLFLHAPLREAPMLQTMSSTLPADPADTSTWQTVLTDPDLPVLPVAWLDWAPKPGTVKDQRNSPVVITEIPHPLRPLFGAC